jgi:DMSO/TMAO reductase YedYZ molybdopterin-dependent catalytic subunit
MTTIDEMALPPGQRRVEGFPRFGTHLSHPPPAVPTDPVISVRGAVREPFELPLSALADLPRRELDADFHCVAGWSATGLHWEGVSFATFYRAHVEPALPPGKAVTHVGFRGLDGYGAVLRLEDALADDVLIAEHLDGEPLDGDHGAPARVVSPLQYGYMNVKHLSRLDVHTSEPTPTGPLLRSRLLLRLLGRHPRARVWDEERNQDLPAWVVRPVYRALIGPIRRLSATRPAAPPG